MCLIRHLSANSTLFLKWRFWMWVRFYADERHYAMPLYVVVFVLLGVVVVERYSKCSHSCFSHSKASGLGDRHTQPQSIWVPSGPKWFTAACDICKELFHLSHSLSHSFRLSLYPLVSVLSCLSLFVCRLESSSRLFLCCRHFKINDGYLGAVDMVCILCCLHYRRVLGPWADLAGLDVLCWYIFFVYQFSFV